MTTETIDTIYRDLDRKVADAWFQLDEDSQEACARSLRFLEQADPRTEFVAIRNMIQVIRYHLSKLQPAE